MRKLPLSGASSTDKTKYFEYPYNLSQGLSEKQIKEVSTQNLSAVEWFVDDRVKSIRMTF